LILTFKNTQRISLINLARLNVLATTAGYPQNLHNYHFVLRTHGDQFPDMRVRLSYLCLNLRFVIW